MNWDKLLCRDRARDLLGGSRSGVLPEEHRSQFERDYGRSVFCTSVRRLQDKAQVFPLEPLDAVRTRLTHSLEVSTVARDLAAAAGEWMSKNRAFPLDPSRIRDVESIAATCALIHDIGNPPFGHSGEDAIRSWFETKAEENHLFFDQDFLEVIDYRRSQRAQDFLLFEGNAQTFRIVTKLQLLNDLHGLNLTAGTLSALCKYTARSNEVAGKGGDHEKRKPGFFASENDLINIVRNKTGTKEQRNPITFLVEAADDIVYSVVDIEDGIRKGVVTWDTISSWMAEHKKATGSLRQMLRSSAARIRGHTRGALDLEDKEGDQAIAQVFRTKVIFAMVQAVIREYKQNYAQIMCGDYHKELITGCEEGCVIKVCKDACFEFVYHSPETLQLELMGRTVIRQLMDLFWEGAAGYREGISKSTFEGKIYHLMSKNYRRVFEHALGHGDLPEKYCRLQLVTDYICGMTDTFACATHKKMFNG
ncbi:MAG TPA: dNTP triphosphohydrolase [Verrucomicrobiae bacterium]|nr:dNTP triphosphohydrolase [Verrucomicrobiae bacterium]